MAKTKTNSYIGFELDWLEKKAEQLRLYVDSNPFDQLQDRKVEKETARGITEEISATIEAQLRSLTQALKDYAQIIEIVDKLREKEEAKIESRGNQEVSSLAKNFMKNR